MLRRLARSGSLVLATQADEAAGSAAVTVSRRHAEITRTGSVFELIDQRSLNGTYVNGERVDRATLVDGAEVRVGKFRLNFFVAPAERAIGA